NLKLNNSRNIQLLKASSADCGNQFDIILANIVKPVILKNLPAFAKQLTPNGLIILSGLLKDDESEVLESGLINNLVLKGKIEAENWICLQMIYKPNVIG